MVIDPSRKRFVMNMQLRQLWQYFARAKPDFSGFFIFIFIFFYLKKSQKCSKKARISKPAFKNSKVATLLHKN